MLAVGDRSWSAAGRNPSEGFGGSGATERSISKRSLPEQRRPSPTDDHSAVGLAVGTDLSSRQVAAYRQAARRLGAAEERMIVSGGDTPSAESQQIIARLKATDLAVRAHEAAHVAAGGPLVRGGASFSMVKGPDGKMYATAGEVSIDTAAVPGNPQATIQKMVTVRAAALAPADPSAADQSVAAAAVQVAARARAELAQAQMQEAAAAYAPEPELGVPGFAATA